jgi:bifunctional DNA-binding transcriptional regulator/antitoxin component of YhaV-PrlF toxin-antitoxin module
MVTTVTGKNQVTIPAEVAAELGIVKGMRVEWTADKRRGTLQGHLLPDRQAMLLSLRGAGRAYLKRGRSAVTGLVKERVRDDKERGRCA